MSSFGFVRIVVVVLGAVTVAFFFINDTFRLDNIFLIPDLLLCALLLIAAVIPQRLSGPLLIAGFGAAAGIFGVFVASYAVRGEVGWPSLIGVVISVAMVVVLVRFVDVGPTSQPAGRRAQV